MRRGEEGEARGVLLASLPFDAGRFPSLALSLLKASLLRCGIRCDVRYFSLDYIDYIGRTTFALLNDGNLSLARLGDWVFAAAAHEDDQRDPFAYLTEVLAPECRGGRLPMPLAQAALQARAVAPAFIARCVEAIRWDGIAILGLTTSFQQNTASLAFARAAKKLRPELLVVLGGSNCAGEMGEELHRRYDFVDAVCLGEGDRVFPQLVRRHLAGEPIGDLPGIVQRDAAGRTVLPRIAFDQIDDMDSLPYPDHSDFYAQRAALPALAREKAGAVFETARGCWWGMKNHCSFCGLNGRLMSYRSKSQPRAYDELVRLVDTCGDNVLLTDAILDLNYFDGLLPRLAESGPDIAGFWQMKVNLKPEWIALLARAGITRIQPGIEALDTPVLNLMRKGCTMLQNVQTLRLAAENGMTVAWNLLYGLPGEDPGSYTRTAAVMPLLRHLQPPMNLSRTLADRFSPYFNKPDAYGVALEPAPGYAAVYPFEDESVRRLAYHFHMRSPALDGVDALIAPVRAERRLWRAHHPESALYHTDDGVRVVVTEGRWGFDARTAVLDPPESALIRGCYTIATLSDVARDSGMALEALAAAAERLLDAGWLLREGNEYLALPLRQPGFRRAPTYKETRIARAARRAAVLPEAA